MIIPTRNNVTENEVEEARLTKQSHSFHFILDSFTDEIVDLWHFDSTRSILERVKPLETILIAEGSTTLPYPASSAPTAQIVKVNTSEICPTLRKDMDLVQKDMAQQDENNDSFAPVWT